MQRQKNESKFWVFDNSDTAEQTLDCFTIILENGDISGCSHHPFRGFGQHCGNILDTKFGNHWEEKLKKSVVKRLIRNTVSDYIREARRTKYLGKEVRGIGKLPPDVLKFIIQDIESDLEDNKVKTEEALNEN